jgi:hypothetical protein
MQTHDRAVLKSVAVFALLAIACGGSPTEPADMGPRGLLYGVVTIGPNCPVEQAGQPCPPPPDAFKVRKVLVYDEARTKVLFTVDLDSGGSFSISLRPGKYTVDMKPNGIDKTSGVPAVVTITANTDVRLDIQVDTGIR